MNSHVEELISKNIQYLKPNLILDELSHVIKFYKLYITEVDNYILNIDNTVREVKMFYNQIYNLCLQKINGFSLLSNVGFIFIFIIRYLEHIRNQWNFYIMRFKVFFSTFNKYVSQFVLKVHSD